MKREEILKIAKEYPEELKAYPRGMFIEQLTDFLIKIKCHQKNQN